MKLNWHRKTGYYYTDCGRFRITPFTGVWQLTQHRPWNDRVGYYPRLKDAKEKAQLIEDIRSR